ncbi:unnamed protein product [Darwinula stevensoni]|uniref:Kringle domain-containing protein n=1 Tax=Darwinula stevensoni TaxID=69355 RepID=A0A7R9A5M2_9CRUS|nr:unnamed protein product [Darwinula stevensoni]CAG0895830.1 unnamed protein product [Darwinula stevensoni]
MQGVKECKVSQKGGEYMGTKNRSISGFPCNPWVDDTSLAEDRVFQYKDSAFPDHLTDKHNYCRNPKGNPGGPWCNIQDSTGSGIQWEYCDVPFCTREGEKRACKTGDQCDSSE